MMLLDELREQPLKYPVKEWAQVEVARWAKFHTGPSSEPNTDEYLDLVDFTFSKANKGVSLYGDMEPEWEELWHRAKQLRVDYRENGTMDVPMCYIILDQILQLDAPDCNLEREGFLDRYIV